jgi:hypothetical protein
MVQEDDDDLRPRIRMAVVRDADVAEAWCAALIEAGIDAFVEIDDERNAMPGQNPLVGITGGALSAVYPGLVYAVSVPAEDRDRAAAVLIDHGWTGGRGGRHEPAVSNRTRLTGAAVAIGIALAVAVVLMWLG